MTLEGGARCFGAATIINGIATGLGASFGIGLRTDARVRLVNDPEHFKVTIRNDPGEDPTLAVQCVKGVLERFGLNDRYGADIETDSDIPISRGLKSSSAASNAIVLAVLEALGERSSDMDVISMGIEASFRAGVTITGAFDDACASYFGGAVVTDNVQRRILARYPLEEGLIVIVHVPEEKIRKRNVDTHRLSGLSPAIKAAHDLALKGDYRTGLMMNGLMYGAAMGLDTSIALKALEHGAMTAGISGTGPATVVLCGQQNADAIVTALGGGHIIRTVTNDEKAGPIP
ncbi:MAG: shikimate kinase [Candidatus Thermoplasmatota archaeon]|jgi:shikimate kinase|nr:shikimate kinase [Candidatus Thermoplasmatota archaeon]